MRPAHVVRVLAPNPSVHTLEGTNTWIVGSDPSVVIDPGPDDRRHLQEVAREAGRVAAIVVTHGHPDHAPGAAPLAVATGAPILALRPANGGRGLRDGERIEAGGVSLIAMRTPGHAPDHVAFRVAGGDGVFTGDAVLGRGTSVLDPPDGDLAAYLRSLRRLLELRPRTLYPGHGPLVLDGTARIERYLAHREERERQIVSALRAGPRTIDEIVAAVYPDDPTEVRALAARSVLAHLQKLRAEGRADRRTRSEPVAYALLDPRPCARCGRPVEGRGELCEGCRVSALQEGPDGRDL